jgi:hypothetical protein
LIYLALRSLWYDRDAASGWVAIPIMLAMLVELCILPVCTESILLRARPLGFDQRLEHVAEPTSA